MSTVSTIQSNSQPKLSSVHLPCVSSATTNDEAPLLEDINNNGDDSDVDDVDDEEDPLAEDNDNINDDLDDGVDELLERNKTRFWRRQLLSYTLSQR